MTAETRVPRLLQPGDAVAVVSPASWPDGWVPGWLSDRLEAWDLRARVGEHALNRHGFLAGTDEDRLADLNAAIRDPEIRAIIATGGGCGSLRLLHGVDVDALRADPKPLLGYSDITALHLLWRRAGIASLHGAIAGSHSEHVRRLLTEGADTTVATDSSALSAGMTTTGTSEGILFGGNLEMLARSVGVVDIDPSGGILLLEINRAAGLGMVDRALTQLRLCGGLDGIVGVALGAVDQFDGYQDRGWTILDVLRENLGPLGVPILGGLPLGHLPDPVTVPLGLPTRLDTAAGELRVRSFTAP